MWGNVEVIALVFHWTKNEVTRGRWNREVLFSIVHLSWADWVLALDETSIDPYCARRVSSLEDNHYWPLVLKTLPNLLVLTNLSLSRCHFLGKWPLGFEGILCHLLWILPNKVLEGFNQISLELNFKQLWWKESDWIILLLLRRLLALRKLIKLRLPLLIISALRSEWLELDADRYSCFIMDEWREDMIDKIWVLDCLQMTKVFQHIHTQFSFNVLVSYGEFEDKKHSFLNQARVQSSYDCTCFNWIVFFYCFVKSLGYLTGLKPLLYFRVAGNVKHLFENERDHLLICLADVFLAKINYCCFKWVVQGLTDLHSKLTVGWGQVTRH